MVKECIKNSKDWQDLGYATNPVVTLNVPEDRVEAQFEPSSGAGWNIFCQGQLNVRRFQINNANPLVVVYVVGCISIRTLFQTLLIKDNHDLLLIMCVVHAFFCAGSAKSGS